MPPQKMDQSEIQRIFGRQDLHSIEAPLPQTSTEQELVQLLDQADPTSFQGETEQYRGADWEIEQFGVIQDPSEPGSVYLVSKARARTTTSS